MYCIDLPDGSAIKGNDAINSYGLYIDYIPCHNSLQPQSVECQSESLSSLKKYLGYPELLTLANTERFDG